MPGNARNAAARVRGRAALVEPGDRGAVVGPVRCGTLPEQLIGRQFTMEDMSLRQTDDGLEVRGHQGFDIDDLRSSGVPSDLKTTMWSSRFMNSGVNLRRAAAIPVVAILPFSFALLAPSPEQAA